MCQKDKHSHNCQIFGEKEYCRPLKIKKHKRGGQEQIREKLIFYEGIEPVKCDGCAQDAEGGTGRFRGNRPCRLPCQAKDHIPVETQMQGHQHKTPESGQHMEGPGQGKSAGNGKKGKDFPGQDDPAYHGAEHCQKEKEVYPKLKGTVRGIFPFQDMSMPVGIQDMMGDPEDEHRCADPFMDGIAGKLSCHQDQQQHRHHHINDDFYFPVHCITCPTHSVTSFCASATLLREMESPSSATAAPG